MSVRINCCKLAAIVIALLLPFSAQALTWTTNSPLPGAKRNNNVVSQGAIIYSVGGRPDDGGTDDQAANDVYRGTIDNSGVITWVVEPNSLPENRTDGGIAIAGDRIYYWGGWGPGFPVMNTCYYAPLTAGVVGSWVTSAVTLPDSNGNALADSFGRNNLVFKNTLYTINGEDGSFALTETAHYSRLTAGGDYGTWTSTNEPTDSATWWHGIAVFEGTTANYIYKIGGGPEANSYGSALNTVSRAVINPDGSLGTWAILPDLIPAPNGIMDFACIQDGNIIYVVGGADNSGTAQTTTYIGTINPATGDIAWTTDDGQLPEARVRVSGNIVTAPNGTSYLVVTGGAPGTGGTPSVDTVFTAPIPPPATVSDWTVY